MDGFNATILAYGQTGAEIDRQTDREGQREREQREREREGQTERERERDRQAH